MVSRWLVALACPAAAFALGWLAGAGQAEPDTSEPVVQAIDSADEDEAEPAVPEEPDGGIVELQEIAAGDLPKYPARKFVELVGSDPALVASMLTRLSETERVAPTYAVAASWASVDPAAAFEWIDSLPETDMAANARSLALCVWFDVDPMAALEFFRGLEAEEQRRMIDQPLGWQLTRPLDQATDREVGYTHDHGTTAANVFLRSLPAGEREEILVLMDASTIDRVQRAAERARGL